MIVTLPAGLGLVADQAAHEAPDGAWSLISNMRFVDGYAERCKGHLAVLTTPSAAPYHVVRYQVGSTVFWVHATLTGAFADDATTKTDISGTAFTGDADDTFTSCVLGGVLCLNNGKDVPVFWGGDTGSNYATLTGWDSSWRCKSLRSFKYYLLALNVTKTATNYGSMVKWSHAAPAGSIPSSWDETDATLDAGEIDLAETSDTIIDGLPMGDTFVVYKDHSTYGLQYIGGNDIFRQFRLPGDHGMMARNCVVQTPMGHVVLTLSDMVIHNGTGPTSVLDGRARRWMFNRIDTANYRRSFLVHNPALKEVWACYPTVGESACTEAAIWNYKNNTVGVRALPNVTHGTFGPIISSATDIWDGDTETWDEDETPWSQSPVSEADNRLIMSSTAPEMYLMDQTGQFDGTSYTASLERTGLALGDQSTVKLVRRVIPRIDAAAGTVLSIQVGGAMDAETAPSYSAAVSYTVGSSYKADTFASGRFIALRISSAGYASWRLKSLDLDVVQMGRF